MLKSKSFFVFIPSAPPIPSCHPVLPRELASQHNVGQSFTAARRRANRLSVVYRAPRLNARQSSYGSTSKYVAFPLLYLRSSLSCFPGTMAAAWMRLLSVLYRST